MSTAITNGALWYTARATGVVSLVLLTLVVALGIASRSGRPIFGLPRFAVALVHRNASLLAVTTIGIHIATLLLDTKAHIRVSDVLIPFIGTYRTLWLGLGTFALELLAALIVTSLLRSRLPERIWRGVHWLAYACLPVAFAHGFGTGTDAGASWMRWIAFGCAGAIVAAIGWRVSAGFEDYSGVRRPLVRSTARTSDRPINTALGRTR